jgi:GMP synthase-like glutamine amidotransferase
LKALRIPTRAYYETLGASFTYEEFHIVKGNFPDPAAPIQAYLVTGSESSAYDDRPWIRQLKAWLEQLDRSTPLVGICFGHQIMASTFGGIVTKSDRGWLIGLQEYRIAHREPWMDDREETFVLPAVHYDQVTTIPAGAKLIGTSFDCVCAALSYADRRAISFQAHPELSVENTSMIVSRMLDRGEIERAHAMQARESTRRPASCDRVLHWIRSFLQDGSRQ